MSAARRHVVCNGECHTSSDASGSSPGTAPGSRRKCGSGLVVATSGLFKKGRGVSLGLAGVVGTVLVQGRVTSIVLVGGASTQWAVLWCASCGRVMSTELRGRFMDSPGECVCGAAPSYCELSGHFWGSCPDCHRRVEPVASTV